MLTFAICVFSVGLPLLGLGSLLRRKMEEKKNRRSIQGIIYTSQGRRDERQLESEPDGGGACMHAAQSLLFFLRNHALLFTGTPQRRHVALRVKDLKASSEENWGW